jgi:hypothetical protein
MSISLAGQHPTSESLYVHLVCSSVASSNPDVKASEHTLIFEVLGWQNNIINPKLRDLTQAHLSQVSD